MMDSSGTRVEGRGLSRRARTFVRFGWGYVRANFESALEYRASFLSQILAMMLSDAMWLTFWIAYFGKFQVVEGWGRNEIVTLWAVVAGGFGLATGICGNLFRLAGMIVRGELDIYLALPKPVLPHALISRMVLTAPGDLLFGLIGFAVIVHPAPLGWVLFAVSLVTTAMIFVGFVVITQSIAFWLGNSEQLSTQMANAMINFSTYPTGIFEGAVKLVLFTIIPAGFVAWVPIQLLRHFSWPLLLVLVGFASGLLLAAGLVFHRGLRRYESGNLILLRE